MAGRPGRGDHRRERLALRRAPARHPAAPAARSTWPSARPPRRSCERELGVRRPPRPLRPDAPARRSRRPPTCATTTSATSRPGSPAGRSCTAGMAVCPCSMGTVAAIAHGTSENLIHRAADVHLKERRKLILVPRETPLGLVQLRNLAAVAEAGAVVLPGDAGVLHAAEDGGRHGRLRRRPGVRPARRRAQAVPAVGGWRTGPMTPHPLATTPWPSGTRPSMPSGPATSFPAHVRGDHRLQEAVATRQSCPGRRRRQGRGGDGRGAETALGEHVDKVTGIVNVPADAVRPLQRIRPSRRPAAGQQPPDRRRRPRGRADARTCSARPGRRTWPICLLSGGGSALLPAPDGVTLEDKQAVTKLLHACGATIDEMNAVRKHLSRVKGGRLAQAFRGKASSFSLIISDVVGDPLDVIASGPTAADPSTFADALAVLDRYGLPSEAPPAVVDAPGTRGRRARCRRRSKELPANVHNVVLGNNARALRAATAKAEAARLPGAQPGVVRRGRDAAGRHGRRRGRALDPRATACRSPRRRAS